MIRTLRAVDQKVDTSAGVRVALEYLLRCRESQVRTAHLGWCDLSTPDARAGINLFHRFGAKQLFQFLVRPLPAADNILDGAERRRSKHGYWPLRACSRISRGVLAARSASGPSATPIFSSTNRITA